MVIIEILVYVCIAIMTLFYVNVMHKAQLTKRIDFISSGLILSLIIIQIFNPISSQTSNFTPPIALICIGAIFALALIYIITRVAGSSLDTQEYTRGATLAGMFIVFGVILCVILIDLPETQTDLYRMPFALALCVGMAYYPPAFDRLKVARNIPEQHAETETHKETVLDTKTSTDTEADQEIIIDTTTETAIGQHREAMINLATESWRFAKGFERGLTQLSPARARRRTSQLQWFLKKTEESLEDIGLRIVNIEGYPYDPDMSATPVNIEDFEPEEHLVVDQMLEPIIMDGTVLAKTGTVILRRTE